MRGKRLFAFFAAFLMFTGIFTADSLADASADAFGRQVFEGKDGWLFYSGDDTIADYEGTDLYSQSKLERMRQRLEAFRDTLALNGCEFVILIAPNKEQLYSQFMPDSYGALTPYTRAQQVCDYLKGFGFRVVYPINELKAASLTHPEYDIYYRRDTHWDELGAYIGAKALMAELGVEMPDIEQLQIEPVPHDSESLGRSIGRSLKDIGYNIYGYTDHDVDSLDSVGFVVHTTKTGVDDRKVLLVGDSFSLALQPYVSQEFADVTMTTDKTTGIPDLLDSVHPDVFVYETVERYMDLMEEGIGLNAPDSWTANAQLLMQ